MKGDKAQSANLHRTVAEAARMMGVSRRQVFYARAVDRYGIPELMRALEAGKIALYKAAEITKLPPEAQRLALDNPAQKNGKRGFYLCPRCGHTMMKIDRGAVVGAKLELPGTRG